MPRNEIRVNYRIVQAGEVVYKPRDVEMVLIGKLVGMVGNVPCFNAVRFVDAFDRRRARDISANTFGGPATIEAIDLSGEVVGWIGLATTSDVACHPRGELVPR